MRHPAPHVRQDALAPQDKTSGVLRRAWGISRHLRSTRAVARVHGDLPHQPALSTGAAFVFRGALGHDEALLGRAGVVIPRGCQAVLGHGTVPVGGAHLQGAA